ncbi:DMT family transporter [Komagataeibacter diospyri]|uniref:Drug/metabolite transporter superfamily permease n=1 Tax=Komagataeibacter diospyri TaxID=1932662 RepID=A0A4P5NMP9_9PROT|nr:DMT family transporter [Komagataeibacter diospyri]GCE82898.1 drug/metabolite transporter superfamily permease [Komagataeibacter diospyri]GCE89711.1 drug/metabolite transporter superfamily permease [Komagataeibacter diospyri]
MDRLHSRTVGIFLVALSAVLWSTAGLFVRMSHLDTWTIVAWRSFFSFVTLGGFAVVHYRGELGRVILRQGWPGACAVAVSVVSAICYVMALRMTTVANVMIIYAALPFITTGIAFIWLRERVTMRFLVAGGIAIAGIAIMGRAAAGPRDLLGIGAAVIMTIGFATQLVQVKRYPSLDMTIIITLMSGICMLVAVPFMRPDIPSFQSLLACALFGILTMGVAYMLLLKGGQLISSGEAGFVSMLDVPLGPLWVWFFYGERPTGAVMGGGAIVLGAVAWYLLTSRAPDTARTVTSPTWAASDSPTVPHQ